MSPDEIGIGSIRVKIFESLNNLAGILIGFRKGAGGCQFTAS